MCGIHTNKTTVEPKWQPKILPLGWQPSPLLPSEEIEEQISARQRIPRTTVTLALGFLPRLLVIKQVLKKLIMLMICLRTLTQDYLHLEYFVFGYFFVYLVIEVSMQFLFLSFLTKRPRERVVFLIC